MRAGFLILLVSCFLEKKKKRKRKDVPWERNSYCIQRGMKEEGKKEREWCIRSHGREGDGWNFDNVGTEHVLPHNNRDVFPFLVIYPVEGRKIVEQSLRNRAFKVFHISIIPC